VVPAVTTSHHRNAPKHQGPQLPDPRPFKTFRKYNNSICIPMRLYQARITEAGMQAVESLPGVPRSRCSPPATRPSSTMATATFAKLLMIATSRFGCCLLSLLSCCVETTDYCTGVIDL
jgi:hypothetical protein